MPYPGVPKELTPKMDRCVKKVMKDGKSKSSAIAICKTSIMSQTNPKEKEKPWKTVSDKEPKYVFFSNSAVEKKTLNAGKEGQVLKNIEIFKSGTYRGIEYKNSALDKMVANFYFLKSHGIFPNVPVRADHPGFSFFGSSGDIIDKVGGYVAELKRVGKKLVADVRITNSKMWEKIQEGTYVSRSAEIGTYDDNEGTIYTPVLFGFAWVDIPAVEGLSPTFNYSRDNKKIEIISLNDANNMNLEEKKEDTFPPEETPAEVPTETPEVTPAEVPVETPEETHVEASVETPVEAETEVPVEKPAETPVETPVETPTEPMRKESFDKMFPEQAAELKKLKEEAFKEVFNKLVAEGRIAPAMKDKEVEFARTLSEKQFALYEKIKQSSPKIVELDKEQIEGEEPIAPEVGEVAETQKEAEERADKFIEETN